MSARAVLSSFERYQKERVTFVKSVAEMAKAVQNVEALQQAGAMQLLRPLLLDSVPSIQQSAALALGRLANHSEDLAQEVVSNQVLPQLVHSLANQSRYYKKSASFCVRAVSRHSAALALAVVDCGALEPLVSCLEDFDPCVKESAASALGTIASHNTDLAERVVNVGAVPLLVLCSQEPEIVLKQAAAFSLSELAKHSAEQAQSVVDAGAVAYLAPLLQIQDTKVKRQVCTALSHVAKHSLDLAEAVVEADVFPQALTCLQFPDAAVKSAAAYLVREVVKHSAELAQVIVGAGGVALIIENINDGTGSTKLPAIMALGYIAAFSEAMALNTISEHALVPLVRILRENSQEHLKAAAAWTLGQMGKHSAEHANCVSDCLVPLAHCEADLTVCEDVRSKARRALKYICSKVTLLPALSGLVHHHLPEAVMKSALEQLTRVLSTDPAARAAFVHSGGLARIQEVGEQPEGRLKEAVAMVNCNYPEEVVKYYSASYSQQLLQKLGSTVPPAVKA